jgi:hypothetical protein
VSPSHSLSHSIIGDDDSGERAGGGLRIGEATSHEARRLVMSAQCMHARCTQRQAQLELPMRKRCVTMSSSCNSTTMVNSELLLVVILGQSEVNAVTMYGCMVLCGREKLVFHLHAWKERYKLACMAAWS